MAILLRRNFFASTDTIAQRPLYPVVQAKQPTATLHHMHLILPLAAAGYSLVYLLAGGGLGGALVIFIIAKMLGK